MRFCFEYMQREDRSESYNELSLKDASGGALYLRLSTRPVEQIPMDLPRHNQIISGHDGHPATLGCLGSICGHKQRALGVTEFGQTGTIADLYHFHGIDTAAIVAATEALAPPCEAIGRHRQTLH